MITIGENLDYPQFQLHEIDNTSVTLTNLSGEARKIPLTEITNLELVGIKSGSGYCGSMEWGMKNPTFLLPTNFFYNIINSFRRKNDTVFYKMLLTNEDTYLIRSGKKSYDTLRRLVNAF